MKSYCAAALLLLFIPAILRAEEPSKSSSNAESKATAPASSSDPPLDGLWSRRAVPNGNGSNDLGTQFKFFAGKYWLCAHCDDSGYIVYALGGTYEEADGIYTETDDFATRYCQGMIGQKYSFKVSVEGNEFWQIGVNNDYTEKYAKGEGADSSPLASSLLGVWTRTAKPYENAPQAKVRQFKFFAGDRWFLVNTMQDGVVPTTCGGTFKLAGDVLIETTKYSSDFMTHKIDAESKFKVVVKGDTLEQANDTSQTAAKWKRPK